jgi:hypothetical protein
MNKFILLVLLLQLLLLLSVTSLNASLAPLPPSLLVSPDASGQGALVISSVSSSSSTVALSKYNPNSSDKQLILPKLDTDGFSVFVSSLNKSNCLSVSRKVDFFNLPNNTELAKLPVVWDTCNETSIHQKWAFPISGQPADIYTQFQTGCFILTASNNFSSLVIQNRCWDTPVGSRVFYVVPANSSLCSTEVCETVHAFRKYGIYSS